MTITNRDANSQLVEAQARYDYAVKSQEENLTSIASERKALGERIVGYENQIKANSRSRTMSVGAVGEANNRLIDAIHEAQGELQKLDNAERAAKRNEGELAKMRRELDVIEYRVQQENQKTRHDAWITSHVAFPDGLGGVDALSIVRPHVERYEAQLRVIEAIRQGDAQGVNSGLKALGLSDLSQLTFPLVSRQTGNDSRVYEVVTNSDFRTFVVGDHRTNADSRLFGSDGGDSGE